MATNGHQWVNTYKAPLSQGLVINSAKPGEKIALAITEIQAVIDAITGADGKGGEFKTLPDATEQVAVAGVADYMVLQVQGGLAVWDYVRATA